MSLLFHELRPLQAMALSILFKKKRLMLCLPRQFGGKTELGVRIAQDLCARPFTSSSLFLAKSRPAARKAAREKFMRLFDPKAFSVNTEIVYNKIFKTSQCFIDSVDKDPDRIRGGTYKFIHWSEVAFSRIEGDYSIIDVFDKVVQPTLTAPEENGSDDTFALLESTNNGKNGWYDLWNRADEFGFAKLRVPLSEMVTLGLVSQEKYDEVRKTTQPDVFMQEYECEFITFQGKVYPEFRPEKHVWQGMPGPEEWNTVLMSIDWGYKPSATCILFAYVKDDILHIFDEHYKTEELAIHTAESIQKLFDRWCIKKYAAVADHEEDRITELRNRGIPCGKAQKANVLGNRIQVKELFFQDRIKIHPRCVNLIRDLESATWHPKKADKGDIDDTQCTWGHFDAEASLRYLVRELSDLNEEKPPENPHTFDEVSAAEWELSRRARHNEWLA